jgi:hypothetical protein
MSATDTITRNLAAAFFAGPWSAPQLRQRGGEALGQRHRWLGPLVQRLLQTFPTAPPTLPPLQAFLLRDEKFLAACSRHLHAGETLVCRLFWLAAAMSPAPGSPVTWPVPSLPTTGALAGWFGLDPGRLDWFSDCQGREARSPSGPLRHYLYRWLPGRRGKRRLLEQPRPLLKALQRKILHEILALIPSHEAAHGYRPRRSVVSYAAPHVGQRIVLRMDVRDFFPSVRAARVRNLFEVAGYPPEVARLLTGLCTNVVPPDTWPKDATPDERLRFRTPHLPQGAPTSPALANLCAYRLDCRLAGLARKVGATYTRYADDLAFSGAHQLEQSARRFQVAVCRVLLEEGFEINTRKTRFMRRSGRQSLAGVVVNERTNCRRADFDRLKAILCNCVRHGPAGQNREGVADFRAHLAGKIAHLTQLNPARAERLQELFARIDWSA